MSRQEIESKPMNTTKHTPGPWQPFLRYVLDNGRFLATAHVANDNILEDGGRFRFAAGQEPVQDMDEAAANARLIAAAPELLAAAKELVADASVTKEPFPSAIVRRSRIANLQAAIAKADSSADSSAVAAAKAEVLAKVEGRAQ